MRHWFRASREQLGQFRPLDMSMSVGALGRMQLLPPGEWSRDFWQHSLVRAVVAIGCVRTWC
jgi:hypothetical protein